MDELLDSHLDRETPQYLDFASFGQRLMAAIIDWAVLSAAQMIILVVFVLSFTDRSTTTFEDTSFGIAYSLTSFAQIAYFILLESSEKQATLGKQAVGIVVTDMNGNRMTRLKALGRYFAKIPSAFIFGIGFFMQPFTAKQQALHDMIAGTLVFKK